MNIFEITKDFLALQNTLIESGGELTPELETALQINSNELTTKGQGYGYIIKSLEYEVDVIDQEIKRLQQLKKVRDNAIERLKTTLKIAMELTETNEIKTPTLKINFRKSESVEVADVNLLDSEFVKTKVTKEADKIAIKEAIKSGLNVQGAVLVTKNNLQIK